MTFAQLYEAAKGLLLKDEVSESALKDAIFLGQFRDDEMAYAAKVYKGMDDPMGVVFTSYDYSSIFEDTMKLKAIVSEDDTVRQVMKRYGANLDHLLGGVFAKLCAKTQDGIRFLGPEDVSKEVRAKTYRRLAGEDGNSGHSYPSADPKWVPMFDVAKGVENMRLLLDFDSAWGEETLESILGI